MLLDVPYKEICKIPGMEAYENYLIDVNGNVYSTRHNKIRKLSPGWAKKKNKPFYKVHLYDKKAQRKGFYVHLLVSDAFLTEEQRAKNLKHKNKNRKDNSLNNIKWGVIRNGQFIEKNYDLSDETKTEIDLIHRACIEKGLHMSDSFNFINDIVSEMLDEYCSRKGLKKIIYKMKNELNQ